MKTQLPALIWGLMLLIAAPCTQSASNFQAIKSGTVTLPDNHQIQVEIANTQALRERGLMHRTQLENNQGMLFMHRDQAIRRIWMKNTLIALDVLFLSSDGKIVSMLRNLQPCKQDPCQIYSSAIKAQYMLEVNAGFIDKHQIILDQKVAIDYDHFSR